MALMKPSEHKIKTVSPEAVLFFVIYIFIGQRTDARNIPFADSKRQTPQYFSAMIFTDLAPSHSPLYFVERIPPSDERFTAVLHRH